MFNAFYCFLPPRTPTTLFDTSYFLFLLPATQYGHTQYFSNLQGTLNYRYIGRREREPAESKISLARENSSSLLYTFLRVRGVAITKTRDNSIPSAVPTLYEGERRLFIMRDGGKVVQYVSFIVLRLPENSAI